MPAEPDPVLLGLAGSRTRPLTLSVLASSPGRVTGYRIAEATGLARQNVDPELRRAIRTEMVRETAGGFRLVDDAVRALLRKRVPISDRPTARATRRL